jgi:serine/threonine-protein kinase
MVRGRMREHPTLDLGGQADTRREDDLREREPEPIPAGLLDPLIGLTLGEFRVGGLLALGGKGRVYWAEHRELPDLRRAVKVLLDSTGEAERAAFLQEAQAASKVQGLNIVALHDFGRMPTGAREPYLMMELLEGETLEARLLRLEQLPFNEALGFTQQVLAALSVIHDAGLVHRDIKPSNLFLVADPSQGVVVKVMDLGLAAARPKVLLETGVGPERSANRSLTPDYASPEQFGELAVGPASDVYSLGVVLYEMITGRLLFPALPAEPMAALALRHRREAPTDPAVYVPELPKPVTAFMLSLLEKEPQARPTVGAALNQVKRLRERFRDRLRDGPTQVRANPLVGELGQVPTQVSVSVPAQAQAHSPSPSRELSHGPRETQRLRESAVLARQETRSRGLAGFRSTRWGLLAGALVVGLAVVGLGVGLASTAGPDGQPLDPVSQGGAPADVQAAATSDAPATASGETQAGGPTPSVEPSGGALAMGAAASEEASEEASDLAPLEAPSPSRESRAKGAREASVAAAGAPAPDAAHEAPARARSRLQSANAARRAPSMGSVGSVGSVAGPEDCVLDPGYRSYVHRRQRDLVNILGSTDTVVQKADNEINEALAADDCRRVKAALLVLERTAGVQP